MNRVFSVSGFLSSLRQRAKMITKGDGFIDILLLSFWALLDSVPRTFTSRFPSLKCFLKCAKDLVAKHIVINLNGIKFRCVDSESIWILSPTHEEWMLDYLSSLGKDDIFLDVGAHVGKYTVLAARKVGDKGLVVAIEPHPENYRTLIENVRINGLNNVIALNIAAWSEESTLRLFVGDEHGHHSVKKDFGLGFINVQAKALDNVLNELKIKRVNFIKVDVEGAELEVLKGLSETLEKYCPIVVVEVLGDLEKVKEYMNGKGYEMKQINPAVQKHPAYYIFKPKRKMSDI